MESRNTIRWISKNNNGKWERNKLILDRFTSSIFEVCYALRGDYHVMIVKFVSDNYKIKWKRTKKGRIEGLTDWYDCFEERKTIKRKREWLECT